MNTYLWPSPKKNDWTIGRLRKRLNNSTVNHNEWYSIEKRKRKFSSSAQSNEKPFFSHLAFLLGYTLFLPMCRHTHTHTIAATKHPSQNETPTTKFRYLFSVCSIFSLAFPKEKKSFFMQRWTQNDVHFRWRHLLNSIPSENVFVFRVDFNSFRLLLAIRRQRRRNGMHEKNGIFSVVWNGTSWCCGNAADTYTHTHTFTTVVHWHRAMGNTKTQSYCRILLFAHCLQTETIHQIYTIEPTNAKCY